LKTVEYRKFNPKPYIDEKGFLVIPFLNKSIAIRNINSTLVITACKDYCVSMKKPYVLKKDFYVYSTKEDFGWYNGIFNVKSNRGNEGINDEYLEIDVNRDYKSDYKIEEGEMKKIGSFYVYVFNNPLPDNPVKFALMEKTFKKGYFLIDNKIFYGDYVITSIPSFFEAISTDGILSYGTRKLFYRDFVRDKRTYLILYKKLTIPVEIKPYNFFLSKGEYFRIENGKLIANTSKLVSIYSQNISFIVTGNFSLNLNGKEELFTPLSPPPPHEEYVPIF
jgi:hypothetical protein